MIFERHWKAFTLASAVILLFSVIIVLANVAETGFVMKRDVELTGGKRLTFIVDNIDLQEIENAFPEYDVRLYRGIENSLVINMPLSANETTAIEHARMLTIKGEPTIQSIGPVIGEVFWQQAQAAMITALALMSIFVFILFRSPVPSLIVILSAITNMTGAMAVANILGIEMSLGVIAALIIIVAYSVDTDILLASSMLKFHGETKDAMKTGLTMSMTTLAALAALYLITGSPLLQTMALMIMIGILIDIPVTWLTNAGLLRLWNERKKHA